MRKISKSNDPLKDLGVGISSFHQLLIMLFALFFVLALLHIPVLQNFRSFEFYKNADNSGLVLDGSMGNMGFSETKCISTSMFSGNYLDLDCKTGTISDLVDWGIIAKFED
jgi:hypothetical protein